MMSVFHLLESQNIYPQVVSLNLNLAPGNDARLWDITAQFDQPGQWLSLLSGRVKAILRRGVLKLQGQEETLTLNTDLPPNVQRLHHASSGSRWQVYFPESREPLVVTLGNLYPTIAAALWHIVLTIEPGDLAIAECQGLWPPDLSPNQLAIADRLIALFLVTDWFPPALSWSQWAIGSVPSWQPLYPPSEAEGLREKETILGERLQVLANTPVMDFLDLAQLVGLDPQRDLAGGKFVGVSLGGVDLSGANLAGSNFRGAILTDADLSGANLAGSNFRGADLSGAYLEGANLTHSDFGKSSLALANLIGADLTATNLRGTTLNGTNFSAANLSQAHLGDNPGLTAEQQAKLIEQGANFGAYPNQKMLS